MSKPIVQFVDSLTGSGKTTSTIKFIAASSQKERFIIGTPNTHLSMETAVKLAAKGVSVLQIDSRDGTNCASALIAAIQKNEHKVIIVNRDVVLKLDRSYTKNRHLIIDEIPPIYDAITIDGIVISKAEISSYFSTFPSRETPDFLDVHISPKGVDFLTKWRGEKVFVVENENKKKSLPGLLEYTWNLSYRVVISSEAYRNFVEDDGKRLTFFILLQPTVFDGFKSLTILGANFKDSMLYLVYHQSIKFVSHPTIAGFYTSHAHKAPKTKLFFFSKVDCSKNLLGKTGFQKFFDAAAKAVQARFPNRRHIFTMNNPDLVLENGKWVKPAPYDWELEGTTGLRVSPDPRGWNDLQDYHMAIHMAALNYTPMDFHFFTHFLSISPEEAVRSMTYERCYQFISRTSFRDYDCDEGIVLVVFDRRTAKWLQRLIGCQEPEFINLGAGFEAFGEEKRTKAEEVAAATAAQARWRENKAEEDRLAAHELTIQTDGFGSRVWNGGDDVVPTYETLNFADLVELFRVASETDIKFKKDCSEFREGQFFDLGNRLIAGNLISSKLMPLDIDKSSISPREFSDFLTALSITHIICNSFSNKPFPYSYHVLIPMTENVNENNYRHIFNVLRGYIFARFGGNFPLDSNFGSINKWIKMPCRSKWQADVFIAKNVWRDILTKSYQFLDVRDYLTRRVAKENTTVAPSVSDNVQIIDAINADAIVAEIALIHATPGNRDHAFKVAGKVLLNGGVADFEAIRALNAAAKRFGKDAGAACRLVRSLRSIDNQRSLVRYTALAPISKQSVKA